MPVSVKVITLWRREVENRPGTLARALEPLARAGVNLSVLMAYRYPGQEETAAIEVYPVSSKKAAAAAQAAGLTASSIPTLLVEGENRAGQAYAVTKAIAEAGINVSFFLAQVVGRKYTAILGFETQTDARRASSLIKRAKAPKKT